MLLSGFVSAAQICEPVAHASECNALFEAQSEVDVQRWLRGRLGDCLHRASTEGTGYRKKFISSNLELIECLI